MNWGQYEYELIIGISVFHCNKHIYGICAQRGEGWGRLSD